jgi:hypothetical protein
MRWRAMESPGVEEEATNIHTIPQHMFYHTSSLHLQPHSSSVTNLGILAPAEPAESCISTVPSRYCWIRCMRLCDCECMDACTLQVPTRRAGVCAACCCAGKWLQARGSRGPS